MDACAVVTVGVGIVQWQVALIDAIQPPGGVGLFL